MLSTRRKNDIFDRIEWYAIRIAATVIFLVFVGVELVHAIVELLAR
jgi:hypothetical protein